MSAPAPLRNIAIIAHVDHGKTTLVDQLFRQSGTFRDNQRVEERAMDSNDLEKERGITILAKCTSVEWDGPQRHHDAHQHRRYARPRRLRRRSGTHSVDGRWRDPAGRTALKAPCRRPNSSPARRWRWASSPSSWSTRSTAPMARAQEVLDEVFDLFVSLDASDEQLDFPVLYASGRNGYASEDQNARSGDLTPLFAKIVEHVPPPSADRRWPVQVPRHPARSRQLPWPHPDRQGPVGHDQGQFADPCAR